MKALERLRQGEPVMGLLQTFPEAAITELAIWCGFDFVIIDSEHGVADEAAQVQALRAASAGDAFALVRVRTQDESAVARYLDFGADGVMVPDVRTPDQAKKIAFAATRRWTGGLRLDRYGLDRGAAHQPNPLVLVLIEAPEGVRNIEQILDIEGIDGAIVGPGDLSTHLGMPGAFTAPEYLTAVERVERAARARAKILGAKPYPGFPLAVLLERGYRFIMVGRDMALVKEAFVDALAAAKQEIARLRS